MVAGTSPLEFESRSTPGGSLVTEHKPGGIFVSYNYEDLFQVELLHTELLKTWGIEVYVDRRSMPASADWQTEVDEVIHQSRVCVVVLGANGWGPSQQYELAQIALWAASTPETRVVQIELVLLEGANRLLAAEWIRSLGPAYQNLSWVDWSAADLYATGRIVAAILHLKINPVAQDVRAVMVVREQATRWVGAARNPALLYTGGVLRDAEQIALRLPDLMTRDASTFLAASSLAEDERRRAERRRLRLFVVGLSGLSVALAIAAVIAFVFQREARTETVIAGKAAAAATKSSAVAREAETKERQRETEAIEARQAAETARDVARQRLAWQYWNSAVYETETQHWSRALQFFLHSALVDGDLARVSDGLLAADLLRGNTQLVRYAVEPQGIKGASLSRDGRSVLTWNQNGAAFCDVATGRSLTHHSMRAPMTSGALLSRDETRILTWGSDGIVRIWDARGGLLYAPPFHQKEPVSGAEFDPGYDRVLSWSDKGSAWLWSTRTGNLVHKLDAGRGVWKAIFDNDGSHVFTCTDSSIGLWNGKTGEPIDSLRLGVVSNCLRSGNTVVVSLADDSTKLIRIDASSGSLKEMPPLQTSSHGILSNSGSLLFTWGINGMRIWDPASGKATGFSVEGQSVSDARFSPDDTEIVTWSGHVARLWVVANGKPVGLPVEHESDITGAAISTDNKYLVTRSLDGAVHVRSSLDLDPIDDEILHGSGPGGVLIAASSRLLTWSAGGALKVWMIHDENRVARTLGVVQEQDAIVDRSGRHILLWSWGLFPGKLIDLDSPANLRDIGSKAYKIVLDPTNSCVAVNEGRRIEVFSVASGKRVGLETDLSTQQTPPVSNYFGIAVSRNCERVVGWGIGAQGAIGPGSIVRSTAFVFETKTGRQLCAIGAQGSVTAAGWDTGNRIDGAALSPDGAMLVTWGDQVKAWSVPKCSSIGKAINRGGFESILVSSDNSRLITLGWDGAANLWSVTTGQTQVKPMRHPDSLVGASFNSDGSRLLTWSGDGAVRLWQLNTGGMLARPMQHGGRVIGAAFSRDESRILSWSWDGTARVWSASTGDPISKPMHQEGIIVAGFNEDAHRVITSNGRILYEWALPNPAMSARDENQRRLEAWTGTELDEKGALAPLSQTQWVQRIGSESEIRKSSLKDYRR